MQIASEEAETSNEIFRVLKWVLFIPVIENHRFSSVNKPGLLDFGLVKVWWRQVRKPSGKFVIKHTENDLAKLTFINH